MKMRSTAGLGAMALLLGSLACAGSMARPEDQAGAAPQDTSDTQNPPGYRGMERDTAQTPADSQATPSDTFLQQQGTGVPADTAGYSGLEQPDTTGAAVAPDSAVQPDTTGAAVAPDSAVPGMDTSGMSGMSDTTAMPEMSDTTSQQ